MERVSVADVESRAPSDEAVPPGAMAEAVGGARVLAEPLGIEGLSMNHYELDAGESLTLSKHRHGEQEEVFYVLSGTVTFETEDGEETLGADEAVRVPPGEFQLGTNREESPATVLALGAPREYRTDTEWLVDCEACGERTTHVFGPAEADDEYVYRCTECEGATHRVRA